MLCCLNCQNLSFTKKYISFKKKSCEMFVHKNSIFRFFNLFFVMLFFPCGATGGCRSQSQLHLAVGRVQSWTSLQLSIWGFGTLFSSAPKGILAPWLWDGNIHVVLCCGWNIAQLQIETAIDWYVILYLDTSCPVRAARTLAQLPVSLCLLHTSSVCPCGVSSDVPVSKNMYSVFVPCDAPSWYKWCRNAYEQCSGFNFLLEGNLCIELMPSFVLGWSCVSLQGQVPSCST